MYIGIGDKSASCGAAEEASTTESSPATPESRGAAPEENLAQAATSTSGSASEDIIDIEGGAALATRWGRKLQDWAGADRADAADLNRTFVVKPTAVGLGSVPGGFVFVVTGLPQAALCAHSLLSQVGCACCSAGTCAVDGPCCPTLFVLCFYVFAWGIRHHRESLRFVAVNMHIREGCACEQHSAAIRPSLAIDSDDHHYCRACIRWWSSRTLRTRCA